jgi:hypothetical protein
MRSSSQFSISPRRRTRCHEIDTGNDLHVFEPEEHKGGRVKVYGCSPGCLLVSIVLSVFLTLAVNGCLHLVG